MAGPSDPMVTTTAEAAAKLDRYTTFAQSTLEPALISVQATAAELATERQEYAELRVRLEEMVKAAEQGSTTMELLTDLGREVFVTARVPDTSLISVNLGLGQLFLQLTPAEGAVYCAKREVMLATRAKLIEAKELGLRQQLVVIQNAMQDVLASRADAMLAK